MKIADGAEAYSALTQFFLYQKEETDTYLPTGSALAASRLWSHAGVSRQELRSLPWNGGYLGQRQWARLATRIQTDAPDICDVVVQKVCNGSGNLDEHAFLLVSSRPKESEKLLFSTRRLLCWWPAAGFSTEAKRP